MATPAPAASLTLAAQCEDTARLADWVGGLAAAHGLSADMAFRVDLCLMEAVGNVASYAYDDAVGHCIAVHAWLRDGVLEIAVEDDGRPFDPLTVASPDLGATLQDVAIGGLGVHLIRNMADDVRYQRLGERNRLLMAFRERQAPSSA